MVVTLLAQFLLDPQTAMGLPADGKDGADLAAQLLISHGLHAWVLAPLLPVIVATGGNGQMPAQCRDEMFVFHCVDPGVAVVAGGEWPTFF